MLAAIALTALLSVTPTSDTATYSDNKPSPGLEFSAPDVFPTDEEFDEMARQCPYFYKWYDYEIFYIFTRSANSKIGPGTFVAIDEIDNWA